MKEVRDMVSGMDFDRYFVITRTHEGDWYVSCYHEDGTGVGKELAREFYETCKNDKRIMRAYLAENVIGRADSAG